MLISKVTSRIQQMTCRFRKIPVVFNKSLVDLENCTSFVKSTCDLLNSTCEINLLKLLARHMIDFSTSTYKVRTKLAFQTNDFESLVIEFDKNIFFSKKNIIVCIFYRSPNSSSKLFNEKLDNILDIIHREKKVLLYYG